MAQLRIGQQAPSVPLNTVDNQSVDLSTAWAKKPALLIFLRHLG